jgi:hypothetical protein
LIKNDKFSCIINLIVLVFHSLSSVWYRDISDIGIGNEQNAYQLFMKVKKYFNKGFNFNELNEK